jgi:uncharacterized protein
MLTADALKKHLNLQPHPAEGGYFVQTYRSQHELAKESLPSGYPGARPVSTAIYYMLTAESFSAMHRLRGDEVFHFYLGDPVEMLQLRPDGTGEVVMLGADLGVGMHLQYVVPGGAWQGCRVVRGGDYALLGTTVAPGFDYADFEIGNRQPLAEAYPKFSTLISELTRR